MSSENYKLVVDPDVFAELDTFYEEQRSGSHKTRTFLTDTCTLDGKMGTVLSPLSPLYRTGIRVTSDVLTDVGELIEGVRDNLQGYITDTLREELERKNGIDDMVILPYQLDEYPQPPTDPQPAPPIGGGPGTPGGQGTPGGGGPGLPGGSPLFPGPGVTPGLPEMPLFPGEDVLPEDPAGDDAVEDDPVDDDPAETEPPGDDVAQDPWEYDADAPRGFGPDGQWYGPGGFGSDGEWCGPGGYGPDGQWQGPGGVGRDDQWEGPGGVGPDGAWHGEGAFGPDGEWYGPKSLGPDGQWYGPGEQDEWGRWAAPEGSEPIVEIPYDFMPQESAPRIPWPIGLPEPMLPGPYPYTPDNPGDGDRLTVEPVEPPLRAYLLDQSEERQSAMWEERAVADPLGRSGAELRAAWDNRDPIVIPESDAGGGAAQTAEGSSATSGSWGSIQYTSYLDSRGSK